jgi:hypothetical protein
MSFFSRHKKPARPPEWITPPEVNFIGEQSGPIEDEIKAKFREVFGNTPTVLSAYLARLSLGEPAGYSVGLCIRSTIGLDPSLQQRLARIFIDIGFNSDQQLDILFIREDQEQELRRVCRAFYVLSGDRAKIAENT